MAQLRPKYRFATTGARDAFLYDPTVDKNQWVEVGSADPYTLYRISSVSSAGVATFDQIATAAPPSGAAGGDLAGSFPNPTVAAIHETSGPTKLTIGTIADGEFLKRVGATLVSAVAGAVTSVFGRTGAVTAQSGDYTAAQVGAPPTSRAINSGTGLTGGGDLSADRTLAVSFGTSGSTACVGNDSRLSDSRAPSGAAGGDLGGTYPNPKVAALTETSGPTSLVAGTITDGQFLKRSGSALISGSPGVGGVNIWFPDAPPSSPSSKDDEFTAGSLDAKWLAFDPAGILTKGVDTTKRMCKLSCTGNGTIRFCGIYQTTPASEFAVYAKVAYNYPASSNGATVGLFVSEDLSSSPGTKRFSTMERIVTTTSLLTRSRDWSAYNGSAANANTHNSESAYMRIRMNGAVYFADFSPDGVSWVQQATRTLAYTPTDFGLIIEAGDSGVQFIGYIDFFRVFTGAGSSGIDATQIGQYV